MTFYFYDLETSGFNPRTDRIMQFAGQRTTLELETVGEPDNLLIKMTPDVLPEPGAVLVHGITPQRTLKEGVTEAKFCKYFEDKIFKPDTVFVGFNNLRFDNEFIRFTLWRNFFDAYEWSWKNGCSLWDMLDLARATRALRPEGINWPFDSKGKPTNRLQSLSTMNSLPHVDAHDALSDVNALISLAALLRQKQPRLFDYFFNIRTKDRVRDLVTQGKPLLYTSGRYSSDFCNTTVVVMVAEKADNSGALMYDLRIDPEQFTKLDATDLKQLWQDRSANAEYFPVKELKYNRCPALSPIGVLDGEVRERINLDQAAVNHNLKKLSQYPRFGEKLKEALDSMWPKSQPQMVIDEQKVDGLLYEGFVNGSDKIKMSAVRAAGEDNVGSLGLKFSDARLESLLPLYISRNFPGSLSPAQKDHWKTFVLQKLNSGGKTSLAEQYFQKIDEALASGGLSKQKFSLLEDLKDYGTAITPAA